jgi:hydrogenase maturation protease
MPDPERRTVIGIGNIFRQDDGAGIEAARRLRKSANCVYEIIDSTGEGAELLEMLKGRQDVLIVDAVSSGKKPGSIHRFDAHAGPLPSNLTFGSSHAFGVAAALEMARAMGWLPATCELIGIEGKAFGFGSGLSPVVESAISKLVHDLLMRSEVDDNENLLTSTVDESEETGEGLI